MLTVDGHPGDMRLRTSDLGSSYGSGWSSQPPRSSPSAPTMRTSWHGNNPHYHGDRWGSNWNTPRERQPFMKRAENRAQILACETSIALVCQYLRLRQSPHIANVRLGGMRLNSEVIPSWCQDDSYRHEPWVTSYGSAYSSPRFRKSAPGAEAGLLEVCIICVTDAHLC